jgi:hypothetical protein
LFDVVVKEKSNTSLERRTRRKRTAARIDRAYAPRLNQVLNDE